MKLPGIITISVCAFYLFFLIAFFAFLFFHLENPTLPLYLVIPVYAGSLGIVLIIAITWVISDHVAHQLGILIAFAESITKGNLKERIDHTSYIQEISILTQRMNDMAITADTLTNTLEKKVAERTDAIEAAKQDIETKLIELNRMNKIMVGRELKMIDLKKELQTLTNK